MGRGAAGLGRRGSAVALTWRLGLAIPALMSGCYYVLALVAALRRGAKFQQSAAALPGVSVLKPVHGWDDHLAHAIATHAAQRYPEFELLLGVRDTDTRALEEIRQAQRTFPACDIRIVPVATVMPNGKVGSLHDLAEAARHPILVINDADICVQPDYLERVTQPLQDVRTGLVTALYRATAQSTPARFEALGVATEFAPSVLVARLLGVAEFALGSTMAVRAADLQRIGGFRSIGDFLADDYQLGVHITRLGLHVVFADTIVETTLGSGTWSDVWSHQVRWSRTIRVSRPSGYYGYVVTQATFWACVALAGGYWQIAAAVLAIRLAAGIVAAGAVLQDRASLSRWWLIPVRDLFGFAVWLAAASGRTVEWRGQHLTLTPDGRIHSES
jgi:ceramide glucosyltransferase